MFRHSHKHQRIYLYNSTVKNCKTFRGYYHVFKPGVFDSKAIIKGSRTAFFYALGDRPISFYQNHVSFHRKKFFRFEQKLASNNVKEELKFWSNNINIYNEYTLKPRPLTSCLMFTVASDKRYGGFVLKHLNKEICSAKFDKYEKGTSST